jgi:hypothetical protein
MNAFLSNLVARVTGEAPVLQRRQPALFEPREIASAGLAMAARHVEPQEAASPGMSEQLASGEAPISGKGLASTFPNAGRATISQDLPRAGASTAALQDPAQSTIRSTRGISSDALGDVRVPSLHRRPMMDAMDATSDFAPVFHERDVDRAPADITARGVTTKHDEPRLERLQPYAPETRNVGPSVMPERSARREEPAAMNAPTTLRDVAPVREIPKRDSFERRAPAEARLTSQYVPDARRAAVNHVSHRADRSASEPAPIQVTIGRVEVRAEVVGNGAPRARRSHAPSVEDFVRSRARRPT